MTSILQTSKALSIQKNASPIEDIEYGSYVDYKDHAPSVMDQFHHLYNELLRAVSKLSPTLRYLLIIYFIAIHLIIFILMFM